MTMWTPEEVQKILDIIKQRIIEDEEYKKFCLENPHSAIKELSGKDLPTGLQVKFSESGEALLNIEASAANFLEGELCEQDLELVTGGGIGFTDVTAWRRAVPPKRTRVIVDMPTGVAGIRA